ncbi:MAG: hypothetical protein ER33_14365 [Cyanobium sp. CACIAM 14]|nr:MAG: hypothetical protein ER33_14365 [Cyanobium sp. CACIAM 14]
MMASGLLLIYSIHGFVAGKVRIKGITYTINEPVAFSFSVALISTFALMVPLLVLSPSLLFTPMSIGFISINAGLAAMLRVCLTIMLIFATCLYFTHARLP